MAQNGDGLLEDEFPQAMEKWMRLKETDPVMDHLAEQGFAYWLQKYRTKRILHEYQYKKGWDAGEVAGLIHQQLRALEGLEGKQHVFEFGHGIDNDLLDVERLPSGINKLDHAMGGGFGRKEGNLIISPTGGGKTVCACQLAGSFASQNLKGILLTTEQGHEELEPRLVSNFCGIPFERIKDKVDLKLLNPSERQKYDDFREKMRGRLFFSEWRDSSKAAHTHLEEEVDRIAQKVGQVDFLIVDWIGGALGELNLNDTSSIRHIYQATADKTWDISEKYDMTTIAFAQAHPEKGVNRVKVDSSVLSECKSMGRNACYIIGITALLKNLEDMTDDTPTYKDQQFFYISKGRKSIGGKVPFRRQYEFQRMANYY
jgi:KaiC/GvpD/RAD55 family RecA-like ATPase